MTITHLTRPVRSIGRILVGTTAFTVGLSCVMATSLAAEPKFLGTHKDWNAFMFEENGAKVCYMSSQPKKKEPQAKARGEVYALVTHRPGEKTFDVVSFMAGYTYKAGSEVSVSVEKNNFKLFTDGDAAWARDEKTDKGLVAAMKKGSNMTVKGTSAKGTNTTDTYSLNGIAGAYTAISEACGVKR